MKHIRIPAGVLKANCYVVYDEKTNEGLMIDPGGDAAKILETCRELALDIKYIILTHGHGDHVAGVADIKDATGAEILMNKADDYLIHGGNQKLIPVLRNMRVFDVDQQIDDGDRFMVGNLEVEILGTPGHTPGGVCIHIGDAVFTGDTLFRGSIGRTDFEGGSMEQLLDSIKNKLSELPDATMVYPGHEGATTIGEERRYNPYVR